MTSMWTALQERQENKTAQRLELTLPPRVRLVTISQGPKQSTPTYTWKSCYRQTPCFLLSWTN
jgi:hypothetical protein